MGAMGPLLRRRSLSLSNASRCCGSILHAPPSAESRASGVWGRQTQCRAGGWGMQGMQGQQKGTVHGCQTNVALPCMPLLESARVDPPARCVDYGVYRRSRQRRVRTSCILRCRRHGPNAHGHCQEDKAEQGQGRRMQLQAGQASCVYCISAISDQDVSCVGWLARLTCLRRTLCLALCYPVGGVLLGTHPGRSTVCW